MEPMAKKKTLEDRLIDLLTDQFKQFNRKQDEQGKAIQAVVLDNQDIKDRIETLELKDKAKNRSVFRFVEDKQLIGLFFFAFIVLVLIIANLTQTELPKWLIR